jgi:hypothetical protein
MSLDGFIAGRDDSMEWMTGHTTSLADSDPTVTFLSEPIQTAVDTALASADGRNLVL